MHSICQRRTRLLAISLAASALVSSRHAAAQELQQSLDRLQKAAEKDPALSPELKQALSDVASGLKAQGASAASSQKSALEQAFEKLRFNGDFRLRHETDFELDDQDSRNRERIRFRLGAEYDVNEQIAAGVRVTTGDPADENSPHQNLGTTFDKFSLSLDRAYATWKPTFVSDLAITAGKFGHPFETNPVFSEVVWDADIQPDGIVGTWKKKGTPMGDVGFVAGEYVVLDNAKSGLLKPTWAFVAQANARQQIGDAWKLFEAVGLYRYNEFNLDKDPKIGVRLVDKNDSNATVDRDGDGTVDDYASRFTIWNPIVAIENTSLWQPITLAGEYVRNTRAVKDQDTGYAVGVKIGKNKAKGDWQVYYQWQVMEQDATLSTFTNDDFLLGTNYRGSVFGARYQLIDKVEVHAWATVTQRERLGTTSTTDSGRAQWRARIDLNFRF